MLCAPGANGWISIDLKKKITASSGGFEGKNFGRATPSKLPEVLGPSKQIKFKTVLRALGARTENYFS